jgi:hypothetical protein
MMYKLVVLLLQDVDMKLYMFAMNLILEVRSHSLICCKVLVDSLLTSHCLKDLVKDWTIAYKLKVVV